MKQGDEVEHEKFGHGFIQDVHPFRVTVLFDSRGSAIMISRNEDGSCDHMKVLGPKVERTEESAPPLRAHSVGLQAPETYSRKELCWCGGKWGHPGRHRNLANKRVLSEEVSHRETETSISRRVEEAPAALELSEKDQNFLIGEVSRLVKAHVDLLEVALESKITSAVADRIKVADGHANGRPFEFWIDEDMARNVADPGEVATLFGAKVPAGLLDAIWFSLNTESKARLLSALEMVRYKIGPKGQTEQP